MGINWPHTAKGQERPGEDCTDLDSRGEEKERETKGDIQVDSGEGVESARL